MAIIILTNFLKLNNHENKTFEKIKKKTHIYRSMKKGFRIVMESVFLNKSGFRSYYFHTKKEAIENVNEFMLECVHFNFKHKRKNKNI